MIVARRQTARRPSRPTRRRASFLARSVNDDRGRIPLLRSDQVSPRTRHGRNDRSRLSQINDHRQTPDGRSRTRTGRRPMRHGDPPRNQGTQPGPRSSEPLARSRHPAPTQRSTRSWATPASPSQQYHHQPLGASLIRVHTPRMLRPQSPPQAQTTYRVDRPSPRSAEKSRKGSCQVIRVRNAGQWLQPSRTVLRLR